MNEKVFWLVLGFVAQACFFMRFLVQWIATERAKDSVIPVSFWYYSILGGIGLLAYSIHQGDPVFILGQSTGVIIYARNLVLIKRKREVSSEAADSRSDSGENSDSSGNSG